MRKISDEATERRSDKGKLHPSLRRSVASSLFRTSFDLARLRQAIKPFRLHWFPRLRSTSDHAAAMRARGELFAPALVLTGCQTAGRGRGANGWWSRAGALTVTFAIPITDTLAPHQIPLLAGLAVREAAAGFATGADVQLKWPNDLLVKGRKLAGLLCERAHKVDLIGLGLNVNIDSSDAPPTLDGRLTSLSDMTGAPLDMTTVLAAITRSLHAMLTHQNERTFAQHLLEYDRHHALLGKRVRVLVHPGDPPISGICEGLDGIGRLLLRDRRTLHHVIAGQVQIR